MRLASGESCASPLSLSSCQDLKAGTGSGERTETKRGESQSKLTEVSKGGTEKTNLIIKRYIYIYINKTHTKNT